VGEGELGQRLWNDLTLYRCGYLQLFSQQCGLLLLLDQTQIFEQRRRLVCDRVKDFFAGAAEIGILVMTVGIEETLEAWASSGSGAELQRRCESLRLAVSKGWRRPVSS
jgi:hypothetical protein